MRCKRYSLLLSAYIDREIATDKAQWVARHLELCPTCRQRVASLQKVKSLCQQLPTPVPSLDAWGNFSDRLWGKMELQYRPAPAAVKGPAIGTTWLWKAASILLIASVTIVTFLFAPSMTGKGHVISLEHYLTADRKMGEPISHTPVTTVPAIKPYRATPDIRGLARANLSQAETEFLLQNGFVATSRQFNSFVSLYRHNQQEDIPSFVTVDSAISGLSHILARVRVDLERELFVNKLTAFTTILAERMLLLHEEVPDSCQEASLRAITFLCVADRLLDSKRVIWPQGIESQINATVEQELKLIYNGQESMRVGIQKSPIFGYDIDYNQFKVRWDSAKDDRLKRYYQTLEWYNRCVFRAANPSETQTALLILMAAVGDGGEAMMIWEDLRQLLTVLYGEPDDPHLLDYLSVARKVYGDTITPGSLSDTDKLTRFSRQAGRARPPQIRSELGLNSGLRVFSGVSYDRDIMLQQLLYPYVGHDGDPRVIPKIVDIGVILGHPKALEIAKDQDFFAYPKYEAQVQRYQQRLRQSLSQGSAWQSGGFIAQAWLYESLMEPESKGLPVFTRSDAWHSRKLTSIMCGILGLAEINSRPTFSGKATGNFSGVPDPYPEFFNRMVTTAKNLESILKSVGYPMERSQGQEMIAYTKALNGLVGVAVKSLSGNPLALEDLELLRNFTLGWDGDYEEANINELSILVHRNDSQFDDYFYAGVEPIRELWVACPNNGAPYMARGGIYLLYGFPTGKKILPEHWRKEKSWGKVQQSIAPWIKDYVKTFPH